MLLSKMLALGWALLNAGLCLAQTNTTEWPLHNDGLNTVVEWYECYPGGTRNIIAD